MAKQVCDIQPAKGMSKGQSNEHLRIATSTTKWNHSANFDPTREKLNFEIGKGGVLTEVDKQKSIQRRIKDNLKARELEDPNEGKIDPYHNTVANIILQGSRTRMRELAFGDQKVNWDHGSDNSHITRCPEIEQWAQDMYKFMSRKYGEENIAAFIVHLDESNPHIHCTLLPIVPWEGRDREHFSYRQLFGGTKPEKTAKLTRLHDELAEVNKKWGLERGAPIALTGAQHKSTYRWLMEENAKLNNELAEKQQVSDELDTTISDQRSESRHLNKNIKKAQKRLKGLSTMYENLLQKKEALEQQMKVLEQQLEKGAIDLKTYQSKKDILQKECDEVLRKISTREEQIAEAEKTLDQYLLKQINTEEKVEKLKQKVIQYTREAEEQGNKVDKRLEKKLDATKRFLEFGWPGITRAIEILTNPALDDDCMNAEQQTDVLSVLRTKPKERMDDVKELLAYASEIREEITVATKAEVVRLAAIDVAENYKDITGNFADQINDIAWSLRKGTEFVTESANAIAVCLMVGYNEGGAWVASKCGGGGGQDTRGWRGKDKDEDDRKFFGRCLSAALGIIKPQRVMPQKEVPQKKQGLKR